MNKTVDNSYINSLIKTIEQEYYNQLKINRDDIFDSIINTEFKEAKKIRLFQSYSKKILKDIYRNNFTKEDFDSIEIFNTEEKFVNKFLPDLFSLRNILNIVKIS